jgi:hypothetical protein
LSTRIEDLDPQLVPWARWLISLWPYGQITSTRRTRLEQQTLFASCGAGQCRYPAAAPGHSYHEFGLAFDYLAPDEILQQLGAIWESYGGGWGGERDPIHFQV